MSGLTREQQENANMVVRAFIEVMERNAMTRHEMLEAALAVEIGEPRPDLARKLRTYAEAIDRGYDRL